MLLFEKKENFFNLKKRIKKLLNYIIWDYLKKNLSLEHK